MKFMMMVKADKDFERGIPPNQDLVAAIGKLSTELAQSGVLLEAGGLLPSSTGARVSVSAGRLTVTDGPFAETKELVGGFAIFRVDSRAEAIEHGKTFMKLHADILGPAYEGQLEIRQLADFETGRDCVPDTEAVVQSRG